MQKSFDLFHDFENTKFHPKTRFHKIGFASKVNEILKQEIIIPRNLSVEYEVHTGFHPIDLVINDP